MKVNHELAHHYITALSCTKEGAELVQALEAMRYYHSEGRIAQLGNNSMLVTAVDAYDDGAVKGIVLLPDDKDKLVYQTADWLEDTIDGALFWKDYHSYPVMIPYELARWAVQCVVERSEYEPVPVQYTRPVTCAVDTIPNMYVRLPQGLMLPGLTVDKYAKRKATQPHYEKHMLVGFDMPGYSPGCPIVYAVAAGDIDFMLTLVFEVATWTPEDLINSCGFFDTEPEHVLRAACQVFSGYSHWGYFDTCSAAQCAKHIAAWDFSPIDL